MMTIAISATVWDVEDDFLRLRVLADKPVEDLEIDVDLCDSDVRMEGVPVTIRVEHGAEGPAVRVVSRQRRKA